jgi:hypothetical protein
MREAPAPNSSYMAPVHWMSDPTLGHRRSQESSDGQKRIIPLLILLGFEPETYIHTNPFACMYVHANVVTYVTYVHLLHTLNVFNKKFIDT